MRNELVNLCIGWQERERYVGLFYEGVCQSLDELDAFYKYFKCTVMKIHLVCIPIKINAFQLEVYVHCIKNMEIIYTCSAYIK